MALPLMVFDDKVDDPKEEQAEESADGVYHYILDGVAAFGFMVYERNRATGAKSGV